MTINDEIVRPHWIKVLRMIERRQKADITDVLHLTNKSRPLATIVLDELVAAGHLEHHPSGIFTITQQGKKLLEDNNKEMFTTRSKNMRKKKESTSDNRKMEEFYR